MSGIFFLPLIYPAKPSASELRPGDGRPQCAGAAGLSTLHLETKAGRDPLFPPTGPVPGIPPPYCRRIGSLGFNMDIRGSPAHRRGMSGIGFSAGSRMCPMYDGAVAWKRRAAAIARRSAYRLQGQLERERDPDAIRRLSTRILALRKIAETLDEAVAT
jgi:hypothetical protein